MPLDVTKEYLTKKQCDTLVRKAGLSRSESVSIPRHLAAIFGEAEKKIGAHGTFDYDTGKTKIAVEYTLQSGGAKSVLLHRDSLYALLVPTLNTGMAAPAAAPTAPINAVSTPPLKQKSELGPGWKTFSDMPELLAKEAARTGKKYVLNGYVRTATARMAESFSGELGTVEGVRCCKYRTSHGVSIAIHEDDIPQYCELLKKLSLSRYLLASHNNAASLGL